MNRFDAQQVCPALYILPQTAQGIVFLQIRIFQHDESVAASQLHGRDFEVRSRPGRNASARRHATRQRNALHARIVNHSVRLFMRDQQVGVSTFRRQSRAN
jgi:hypothetical protein